eukprot:gene9470-biopygen6201
MRPETTRTARHSTEQHRTVRSTVEHGAAPFPSVAAAAAAAVRRRSPPPTDPGIRGISVPQRCRAPAESHCTCVGEQPPPPRHTSDGSVHQECGHPQVHFWQHLLSEVYPHSGALLTAVSVRSAPTHRCTSDSLGCQKCTCGW